MDEYERLVSDAFFLSSPLPFSNESAAHARIIMKHIFMNADKSVRLYSDALLGKAAEIDVYDWPELLGAADAYLRRSAFNKLQIKVKTLKNANSSESMVNLVGRYPDQAAIIWGVDKKVPNFMANDMGAFRLEYDEHQAIACANDKVTATRLLKIHADQI